jgi:tRNA A-37 threonylcarbamoyl transferase component Bud32
VRKIKKWIKNSKIIFQHRKKILQVQQEIKNVLDGITFKFASFGGADINYYLIKNKKKFGMLRLAISDHPDTILPIVRFVKEKRLNKEYMAYSLGEKYNLTPKVLFKSDDAIVCEYLKGERVYNVLQKDKSQVWNILSEAVKIYRELHDLDITHLDATLKNFIIDGKRMKVIDFEYYPSEELSLETQKAYDYIRIIEHTLRIIPTEYQMEYQTFIDILHSLIPEKVKKADLTLVKQWLVNIESYPIYETLQEEIFIDLKFR